LGDRAGVRYARQAAQRAKRTAERAASDQTQNDRHRAEQAEIAQWLTIWLQTPTLFEQWLRLRQSTVDYRSKFAKTI
jgi:hypothetical protein